MAERVLVALSGGVDSAVTAYLLKQAGWEPVGIHLRLFDAAPGLDGVCCGDVAAADARAVAAQLGIPFYVRDLRPEFEQEVVAPTVEEYARARTPNPCVFCNHRVRIPALLELAEALGIRFVATGHYVRKVATPGGWRLAEARDAQRDQSYVLYRLTADQLERLLFPLGEYDKPTVRAIAQEAGLFVARKPSSVDLCFAKTYGGIGRLVSQRRPETSRPGPLLDERDEVVGTHPGIAFVTIGQRRGLVWARPTPERRYVAEIDPAAAVVRVAPRERILTRAVRLADPVWHDPVLTADGACAIRGRAFLHVSRETGSSSMSLHHRSRQASRSSSMSATESSVVASPRKSCEPSRRARSPLSLSARDEPRRPRARQVPLRPPAFSISWIRSIVIPRSTAFSMS
jgi:tRNA-specific 2-thiouridylase